MSDGRKDRAAEQAAATSERHGRDLQHVNDRLKALVESLRSEKQRLAAVDVRLSTAAPARPAPGAEPEANDPERRRLAAELALAREAVAHAGAERARLQERLGEIEAENRRLCDDFVAVQERSAELAQLFVAVDRIHGGPTRADTLAALQEIVINVVGSEELAVFDRRDDALHLAHAFGVDPGPIRTVPLGEGALGRAARTGVPYVAGRGEPADGPHDGQLTACVPLRAGDQVVGALAIWRLLGHKPGLGDFDREVFELLSTHAGIALHLRTG